MPPSSQSQQTVFPVRDYDLSATLNSGQAFRWKERDGAWEGVVAGRWVRLEQHENGLTAQTAIPVTDWHWLESYLQAGVDFEAILRTFPDDEPMHAAVAACHGLRLLRQDPWECLASFILSSTKQIVQIRQIIELLCARFGRPIPGPAGDELCHAFPDAGRLAALSEADLRACKMGFRAPSLLAAARRVAEGEIDLKALQSMSLTGARAALVQLPGVGEKIANCVLLFAYDYPEAFPVDVWVMKALRELYFARRRPGPTRLRHFAATHFGPNAGFAQQYLFHYMRVHGATTAASAGG